MGASCVTADTLLDITTPIILMHVDPLLGGDREIGDCTEVVARQQPTNNSRVMVFLRGPLSNN